MAKQKEKGTRQILGEIKVFNRSYASSFNVAVIRQKGIANVSVRLSARSGVQIRSRTTVVGTGFNQNNNEILAYVITSVFPLMRLSY